MLARVERAPGDVVLPSWWPDWTGKCAAIVACGLSAKKAGVGQLNGKVRVIAIKQAVDLCPWADVVYGCDAPWWRHSQGLPEFKGLKLRWAGSNCNDLSDVHGVVIQEKPRRTGASVEYLDRILMDVPGVIGSGGNSGFQALNLAAQFGANRILLIGIDLQGTHFYGRNYWRGANNPDQFNFEKWSVSFATAARDMKALGVDVINCSMGSTLGCFSKMTLAKALERFA